MIIDDLKSLKDIEPIYIADSTKEITDIYTSDLLSWVMGHVKNQGTILLTVLNSINLIAVSTLLDLSAIIFSEGVTPTEDIINKAKEEGINLFKTKDTSFGAAYKIKNMEL